MRSTRSLLALAALALVANTAQAQVLSNTPTVTLNATQLATLTVTLSTPSVSVASINVGTTNFPAVNVTTDWNLGVAGTLQLVGWFATPTAALTDGTNNIPSSSVRGQVNGGAYTPFTGAAVGGVGVAGGSLSLFSAAVGVGIGNRTDALNLQLNLAAAPPAGAYTGTLNLRAIVQ
jgi:hypothetical protein